MMYEHHLEYIGGHYHLPTFPVILKTSMDIRSQDPYFRNISCHVSSGANRNMRVANSNFRCLGAYPKLHRVITAVAISSRASETARLRKSIMD